MLNRVVLVGRLTKDPEYRVTQSGVAIANFTLAVNRTFTNANGERQADFINCIVFRKQAENVNTYLHKGSLAGVDGRLQSRSYDNQEGRRVFVTEVVCESVQFLEPKNSRNSADQYNEYPQAQQINDYAARDKKAQETMPGNNPFANQDGPIDISDDDLPF
ncbi:single-stranded DNA-binding protein [Macrococcoides canis]|uniref:single-stranded DNA-binding protein n=1 Tax=Macrococcoides canis TaxID=1855823 RepID=UPI00105E8546|nr:single-stranded DNA-binding protein [Macrococcus canis]TDM21838.1 single-stranded DNA-binding protein [Macrococcus canis]